MNMSAKFVIIWCGKLLKISEITEMHSFLVKFYAFIIFEIFKSLILRTILIQGFQPSWGLLFFEMACIIVYNDYT